MCRRLTALLLVLFLRRESKLKWGAGPSYIIRSGYGVGGYRQGVVAFLFLIGCINDVKSAICQHYKKNHVVLSFVYRFILF